MAFSGHKAAFEFVKHYMSRLSSARAYQTIRVIRPQPQPQVASILKDVPTGKLVVFAIMSGMGGTSLLYIMSNSGVFDSIGKKKSSLLNDILFL